MAKAFAESNFAEAGALSLGAILVGYGYIPGLSIIWILIFVVIGTLVAWSTKEDKQAFAYYMYNVPLVKPLNPFLFSIDLLIPVIQLRKANYDVELAGSWQRRYFYVHRIFGYILGIYLVAAFSGTIK